MQRVRQPTRGRSNGAGPNAAHRSVVRSLANGRADQVVVGLPLSLSAADSEQTREVRAFADRPCGAARCRSSCTTSGWRRSWRRPGGEGRFSEDSRAAAHVLNGWLDAQPDAGRCSPANPTARRS